MITWDTSGQWTGEDRQLYFRDCGWRFARIGEVYFRDCDSHLLVVLEAEDGAGVAGQHPLVLLQSLEERHEQDERQEP